MLNIENGSNPSSRNNSHELNTHKRLFFKDAIQKLSDSKIKIDKSIIGFELLRLNFFLIIYLFSDREEGKEKEREKHQCVASCIPRTGDLALNPGLCPDWE